MSNEAKVMIGNEKFVEAKDSAKEQEIISSLKMEMDFAQRILFRTAYNLGKMLVEAKAFIKHGQWENWIKERVPFSQRSAEDYMRIYKEYGNVEISDSDVFSSLGYSQAVKLLAVPEEEREQFAKDINAKDLTIAQLQKEIKAMKESKSAADSELAELKKKQESLLRENEGLTKDIESLSGRIEELRKQQKEAAEKQDKELAERLEKSIKAEQKKITDLESEQKKLNEQLKALQASKEEAIAKARADERAKSETALAKKDKELTTATNNFNKKIENLQKKIDNEKQKTKDAENKAKLNEELSRCTILLNNIEKDFEALKDSLKIVQKIYPQEVAEVEKSLGAIIKAMDRRSKLHVVS